MATSGGPIRALPASVIAGLLIRVNSGSTNPRITAVARFSVSRQPWKIHGIPVDSARAPSSVSDHITGEIRTMQVGAKSKALANHRDFDGRVHQYGERGRSRLPVSDQRGGRHLIGCVNPRNRSNKRALISESGEVPDAVAVLSRRHAWQGDRGAWVRQRPTGRSCHAPGDFR